MNNDKILEIENEYEKLMCSNEWTYSDCGQIEAIMRYSLVNFMRTHRNVAIYGYGKHTEHLMFDHISELRDVKIIIDNYFDRTNDTGYKVIREDEIEDEAIDGIIISVYSQRKAVIDSLKNNHPSIDILDFYTLFENSGLRVMGTYYGQGQGNDSYRKILEIKNSIKEAVDDSEKVLWIRELVGVFCAIKDFYSAYKTAVDLWNISGLETDREIVNVIKGIYDAELELVESIPENTVYMLCIDGLCRQDLSSQRMPKLYGSLKKKSMSYKNAYAYSTSTYESLIAAFGENTDQRTRYFESAELEKERCRFIEKAKSQKRSIVLNTGTGRFFNDDYIEYHSGVTTITQHLWDFVITATKTDNLVYYSQPQCESHFPFYNPNSQSPVLDGTFILFDYLDKYGGELRTDYSSQREDALAYIDDILDPFFQRLTCRFIVFADHGSIAFKKDTQLKCIHKQYFGCHEDWIRIPMFIHDGITVGESDKLVSLLDINNIMNSLLEGNSYCAKSPKWIKIGRSAIYNPDFQMVYKKAGREHFLLAFEAFIFGDKKLVVYSDRSKELYFTDNDEEIEDAGLIEELYSHVVHEITVYG